MKTYNLLSADGRDDIQADLAAAISLGRIAAVICLFLGGCLGFGIGQMAGEAKQRRHTVVQLGSPYYSGVYHGKCAQIRYDGRYDGLEACATTSEQEQ